MDCIKASFCYHFSLWLRNSELLLVTYNDFLLSGCLFINSEVTKVQINCIGTVISALKDGEGHRKITINK